MINKTFHILKLMLFSSRNNRHSIKEFTLHSLSDSSPSPITISLQKNLNHQSSETEESWRPGSHFFHKRSRPGPQGVQETPELSAKIIRIQNTKAQAGWLSSNGLNGSFSSYSILLTDLGVLRKFSVS